MKLKRLLIPLIAIVCLLGSVGVGVATGWWQVTAQPLLTSPSLNVEDIKGSSTLQEISNAFNIPLVELFTLLGLPEDTSPTTQLKELEAVIEVSEVRTRIGAYISRGESTIVPGSGLATAAPEGTLAPEDTLTPTASADTTSTPALQATAELAEPACDIRGSMTLQQVSDGCGVPLDVLYKELNLPADLSASTPLKDISSTVSGFEISALKTAVAAYQAQ
ncbi:MAG: hypothetical protein LLG44_03895 [Chloroflexi bacterium]|nr:hypothetical protein [Chloroflexota bacterium]